MADKPMLHVCPRRRRRPPRAPCCRVQEALKAKGVEYDKVVAAHGSPIPFLRKGLRDELEATTGSKKLPAMRLPDGTMLTHSREILAWVEQQPAQPVVATDAGPHLAPMAPAPDVGWMGGIPSPDSEVTMTLHPKTFTDMSLAPVAAEIDLNLQRLRDKTPADIDYELGLALDRPPIEGTREERADYVLRAAVRNVERHGWEATITDDGCRLHLSGGR